MDRNTITPCLQKNLQSTHRVGMKKKGKRKQNRNQMKLGKKSPKST